jgi:hypothetical protein
MPKSIAQIEEEWVSLLREFADAGLQCVLARHNVEKFPTRQVAVDDYTKASERWIELVLKTSDFVRDCSS